MTPAGTSNELDVQNEWEENTQHTTLPVQLLSLLQTFSSYCADTQRPLPIEGTIRAMLCYASRFILRRAREDFCGRAVAKANRVRKP